MTKKDMSIMVPSAGRSGFYRHVLQFIPISWREKTWLVTPPAETVDYIRLMNNYDIAGIVPQQGEGITAARLTAMEKAPYDKVLMLDDDILFYYRPWKDSVKLRNATMGQVDKLFTRIAADLDEYQHVGICHREGNNRFEGDHVFNVRCTRACAFQRDAYLENPPTLGVMEDFDVALQLLTQGHPYKVWTCWAQGQISTQMNGGCSAYRTHEMQEEAARALSEKFPDFVKLRKKQTKGGLGESTDVTIYWKKAYEHGVKQREAA